MGFIDRPLMPGVHHIEDALGVCFTLIVGAREALLLDVGYGAEDVAAYVRKITDLPLTVWLSHGHHDHAMGARWFDQVRLHPEDGDVYREFTGTRWRRRVLVTARTRHFPLDREAFLAATVPEPTCLSGETVDLGGLTVHILPCPGHTPGSVVAWIPERRLLLTGDDWNPCTWVFFPEALGVRTYRENLARLFELPFEWALAPHSAERHPRSRLEAFFRGLTDEALAAAPESDTGAPYGIQTRTLALPEGQMLVFDSKKY